MILKILPCPGILNWEGEILGFKVPVYLSHDGLDLPNPYAAITLVSPVSPGLSLQTGLGQSAVRQAPEQGGRGQRQLSKQLSPQVAIWRKLRRITSKLVEGLQAPKAAWMKNNVVGSLAPPQLPLLVTAAEGPWTSLMPVGVWEGKNALYSHGKG